MRESELRRVQKVPTQRLHAASDRHVANRVLAPAAIRRVTYNRMTDMRNVNSESDESGPS